MSQLTNNERLKQIAKALGELNEEVVYVGGAVIQLYSSDPAAYNPMTTYDVDCVVDVTTYQGFRDFERRLLIKRFQNDISDGAPICRYLYNGEMVDFMPKVDTVIGESNRWYLKGLEYRQRRDLDDYISIYIMPVTYYLASKLDALHSRGGDDYRGAKDFEDIVFVLNNCVHLLDALEVTSDKELVAYLEDEFSRILRRSNILEEISSSLQDDGREEYIVNQIKAIASSRL